VSGFEDLAEGAYLILTTPYPSPQSILRLQSALTSLHEERRFDDQFPRLITLKSLSIAGGKRCLAVCMVTE
jgi:hypothetical protein